MRILIALLVICVGSTAFWANMDRPLLAPDWTGQIKGLSYSPSHLTVHPKDLVGGVTEDVIRRDLEQLSKVTKRVRTYSVNYGQDRVPYIAKEFGMKVTLGLYMDDDKAKNQIEFDKAVQIVKDNPTVIDRVVIANEAIGVKQSLTPDEVVGYIRDFRKAINNRRIEVGTTDVWPTWLTVPGMDRVAKEADFVGIHILPYWDGVQIEKTTQFVTDVYKRAQAKYPTKKIVIGETGWPSEGRTKQGATPSAANQAYFLRHFFALAQEQNYDYYVIEAFDGPWKGSADEEGAVGAFWGIFDAEGGEKLAFTGPLSTFADWQTFATIGGAATLVIGGLVLILMPAVTLQGYLLVASVIGLVVSGALLIVDASSLTYVNWNALGGVVFVVLTGLFTAVLLVTETTEWALSLWRRRRIEMPTAPLPEQAMVSVHLPTHNEPPQMVIQTLNALARLEYKNFEVIVLDNNTKDEADWRPVEAHCRTLGEKFRFFHFDNMKGFKAGALNKALELTNPSAEYIAVIDSDYQVQPMWLNAMMPAFADPKVAIAQAPQDYRDADESLFKSFCYEEYTGFFRIGMVERNEHNAIIQHGTMCVVRKSAMIEVGGWSEWCITEDTELGLRLFEAGYTAHYTPVSMGRGVMPDTYAAFKGQRYRWVYGAMQILKRHAAQIFGGKSKLTLAQRYHFVAGWLPWFADGLALVFGVLALVWTALMAIAPRHFDVPLTALSAVALTLFTVKTIKTIWLHRAKVGTGFLGSAAAAVTGLALAFTVGKAVLLGLFTSSSPFLRTPKCEDSAPWTHALRVAAIETMLLIGSVLAFAATLYVTRVDDPAEVAWAFALVIMAVPHASAVAVAIGSTVKLGRRPVPVLEPQPQLQPVPVYQSAKLDAA
jgi:exo-beta-1,3-glucanase (GH17 family)/cellulose synthase/poly-beta-1,6-N-acetylglucosamine synthase-like glycosyltransferase